ncbi:MAG: MBL fold metallo-hydrolase [Clostridiales bacterium]|jgi:glyoxylase-like metal-dependent hydrolase (beta-lactamase superfamily II)|nr:MBL fold metallo-hydrolase [Clostridiales bacterium]
MPYGKHRDFISKPIKSGRIGDPVFGAWIKELRENNPTKRVYDIDPYVEVYQFRDNLYGLLTHILDTGGGLVWMWLIVGPEKAMLIDTSFGVGDLKGLVGEITGDMPLIVANTHCSPDHSYGNCQFDRCHSHQLQAPDMEWKQDEGIRHYLTDDSGKPIWVEFDPKDFVPFKRYEFVGVPDCHAFELGRGYEVELVNIPGHQPGHSAYLDRQGRFLIGGDAFPAGGLTGGSNFSADERHARDKFQGSWLPSEDSMRKCTTLRDALIRLSKRLGEFDRIFCGHGIQDLDSSLVLELIEACNQIIADPEAYDELRGDRRLKKLPSGGYMPYFKNGI